MTSQGLRAQTIQIIYGFQKAIANSYSHGFHSATRRRRL